MVEKGQCFVRAINKEEKWDSVDILNLDEDSFRRFVLRKLADMGVICIIISDKKEKPLREKKDGDRNKPA